MARSIRRSGTVRTALLSPSHPRASPPSRPRAPHPRCTRARLTSVTPARASPPLHPREEKIRHTRARRGYLAEFCTQARMPPPKLRTPSFRHSRVSVRHPLPLPPSLPRPPPSFLRRQEPRRPPAPLCAAMLRRPAQAATRRRRTVKAKLRPPTAWIPACAGITERWRARVGRRSELGARRGEIPAASAGMTGKRACEGGETQASVVRAAARYPRRARV